MFVINRDKKIILTKGDTATIHVAVQTLDGKPYDIKPTDVITMSVRKTPNSEIGFSKEADSDHIITISSSDTSSLNAGLYVYDVQLLSDGSVFTIVPMRFFELRDEVTNG